MQGDAVEPATFWGEWPQGPVPLHLRALGTPDGPAHGSSN
jgi:hypothetical protein